MKLSSILAQIPFIRRVAGYFSSDRTVEGRGAQVPQTEGSSSVSSIEEDVRRKAIEDTVQISPAAASAYRALGSKSDLTEEDVSSLLKKARLFLEHNSTIYLGIDTAQARSL